MSAGIIQFIRIIFRWYILIDDITLNRIPHYVNIESLKTDYIINIYLYYLI